LNAGLERSVRGAAAFGVRAESAAPLIELREVRKTYRNGALEVEALKGVSLAIAPGEFVAVMGSSGSGKSTLMHILGCLDRPTEGRYLFAGRDVSQLDPDGLAALRREAFGFIFQQYNLIATESALGNVEIPAIYAGAARGPRRRRAAALLSRLGLGDRLQHRPGELSGGQQQRVSIARALANDPQVILADEPTGALDSRSGREVLELLRELNAEGRTVILITHDEAVAAEARRRVRIADGVIVEDEGPDLAAAAPAAWHAARPGFGPFGAALAAAAMAASSLRTHLLRTMLTLLGVIIGVASVIVMLAVGEGAKRDVLSRIEALGSNLLMVRPLPPQQRTSLGVVARLSLGDVETMRALPGVVAAAPEMWETATLRWGSADHQAPIVATGPDYPAVRDWEADAGSFFDQEDFQRYAPVATLGRTVVRKLFPEGVDPVGKYIFVNSAPFLVIGVMAEKGANPWGSDMDDNVFVPLTTAALRLFGDRPLRAITLEVRDPAALTGAQAMIEALLRERHTSRDFQVRTMSSMMEATAAAQNTLTVLLGSVAAISLLVGGIGIMNIMLVSVTERTREIGVRMATGARQADIMRQFVCEALMVCALGGGLGVALGLGATWLVSSFETPVNYAGPPVALAFGCAFLTGLLFGWMPARKAARLDPVTALSAE
jgi:macrolide transport system ATP-binding/permease protein